MEGLSIQAAKTSVNNLQLPDSASNLSRLFDNLVENASPRLRALLYELLTLLGKKSDVPAPAGEPSVPSTPPTGITNPAIPDLSNITVAPGQSKDYSFEIPENRFGMNFYMQGMAAGFYNTTLTSPSGKVYSPQNIVGAIPYEAGKWKATFSAPESGSIKFRLTGDKSNQAPIELSNVTLAPGETKNYFVDIPESATAYRLSTGISKGLADNVSLTSPSGKVYSTQSLAVPYEAGKWKVTVSSPESLSAKFDLRIEDGHTFAQYPTAARMTYKFTELNKPVRFNFTIPEGSSAQQLGWFRSYASSLEGSYGDSFHVVVISPSGKMYESDGTRPVYSGSLPYEPGKWLTEVTLTSTNHQRFWDFDYGG